MNIKHVEIGCAHEKTRSQIRVGGGRCVSRGDNRMPRQADASSLIGRFVSKLLDTVCSHRVWYTQAAGTTRRNVTLSFETRRPATLPTCGRIAGAAATARSAHSAAATRAIATTCRLRFMC